MITQCYQSAKQNTHFLLSSFFTNDYPIKCLFFGTFGAFLTTIYPLFIQSCIFCVYCKAFYISIFRLFGFLLFLCCPSITAQTVELAAAGMYLLETTDSDGCIGKDSLIIQRVEKEIVANFLATTQARKGENIVLINNSLPAAPRYEWVFPENVKIVNADSLQAEIFFLDSGYYVVSLKAFDGQCVKIAEKGITVLDETYFPDLGDVEEPFIKEFKVHPNPNSGNFTITVELMDEATIRLRLIHAEKGTILEDWKNTGLSKYTIPCNMSLVPGYYVLMLETAKATQVLKIIIQ